MDNWDFNLVGAGTQSPFGGYVSAPDRTVVGRRFMVRGSKNVYLKRSGTIANRPGLKRRGQADSNSYDTKASTEWETSLGATRVLRVNNGKVQIESDIVTSGTYIWYDLFTPGGTRLFFESWWDNTLKKDILLMCDGSVNMKSWSGGLGKISSTTVNTIVLTASVASQGFDTASGTVLINGVEYAYTGSSSSTLTGVTPDPTGQADGSVVLQKVATDSDTVASDFDIDFIRVVNNQLYAGSDSSRLVYVSKNTDWDDFTSSSPRTTGEGDTLVLDEVPTGIGVRDGKAHIGSRKAWYEVSFKQITVGTTLSEQTEMKKIPMSLKKGLLRHEFVDSVGNDMVYLSEDQQLYIYGTFVSFTEPQFPIISLDIENDLKTENFTGGHLRSVGTFIYLTAPVNGRVWIHESRTVINRNGNIDTDRFWHAPFIWNISRIAVINGVEYGHSNSQPQLYQLWDTLQWQDDSPTDEAIPYDSVAVFGYRNAGDRRHKLLTFDKVFFEGYMTPGSDVRGAIIYEYQGERAVQQFLINAENTSPEFYMGDVGVALGDSSLGDNPLGDQTSDEEMDQESLPKFRAIADAELQNVFEWQPRVYSSSAGDRWELLVIGGNEEISEEEPVVLRE